MPFSLTGCTCPWVTTVELHRSSSLALRSVDPRVRSQQIRKFRLGPSASAWISSLRWALSLGRLTSWVSPSQSMKHAIISSATACLMTGAPVTCRSGSMCRLAPSTRRTLQAQFLHGSSLPKRLLRLKCLFQSKTLACYPICKIMSARVTTLSLTSVSAPLPWPPTTRLPPAT